ncbi:MAG TPA: adenylate/guanylate cyclase domain-containing protein [Reyranella sp.]|nr:adenylate/guanylate cyclase domain-containing protein [Reyranella sp.]
MAQPQALLCKGCWQNLHVPMVLRAAAVWDHDGLLNKTIGDAVMAVFNFPIKQDDHARQALLAAREIQQRLAVRKKEAGLEFGVGVGLQTGEVSFGEFGRSHRDLTAIGTVVNTAARVQAAAKPGEILVTDAIRAELKGFDKPVMLYQA